MSWSIIIGWVISAVPKALDMLNFTQKALDTTKSGMDVYEAGKKLIEKDATEHPEQVVDRANAIANMTNSIAPLAFAEVLFYAIKTAAVVCMLKWFLDILTDRAAKRIAEKMVKE